MHITELWIHPVKSMQGLSLPVAQVLPHGLAGDRQWLVADAQTGRFITAREIEALLAWQPALSDDGASLQLRAPDGQTHTAHAADYDQRVPTVVFSDAFDAWGGPPATDAWLSEHLGRTCRLLYLGDAPQRPLKLTRHARTLSFADAAPLLLCSQASLAELNRALPSPVTMRHFRPNIVIDGELPYAEDGWERLRIGPLEFVALQPCGRCKMITLDPHTGDSLPGKEPLKTLARTHRIGSEACFGIHLMPANDAPAGALNVGDAVQVLTG